MLPNQMIRNQRLSLGMSEQKLADIAGMSIFEYGDIESHPDEFKMTISISQAKKICSILELDLCELIGIEKMHKSMDILDLGLCISNARKALGLSILELADSLGFDKSIVLELESNSKSLGELPIFFAEDLANILNIDLKALIQTS
jgi:transcriptional regulator with XRE-family HTH domain